MMEHRFGNSKPCDGDCGSCFRQDMDNDECNSCPIGICEDCPHPCEFVVLDECEL